MCVLVQLPSLPGSCVAEVLVDLSSPTPAILQWNKVRAARAYPSCHP
jgi:hypothetical protein